MSVVDSEFTCPQCGNTARSFFDCGSSREDSSCPFCGRTTHSECDVPLQVAPGTGAACYATQSGAYTNYCYGQPLTDEIKQAFHDFLETEPDANPEASYLTEWDPKTQSVVFLYGTIPPSENYEEPPGPTLEIDGETIYLSKELYADGNPRIQLYTWPEHEPYATLSVNLPEYAPQLGADEVFIKTWSENAKLAAEVLDSGLFLDLNRPIAVGYCTAYVWKINRERWTA